MASRSAPTWSSDDLRRLKRLRDEGVSWEAIARHFPGRSKDACRIKANAEFGCREPKHSSKAWSAIDLAILLKHKDTKTRKWIADHLGRTESSVQTKLRGLGYTNGGPKRWSVQDRNTLIYRWGSEPPEKTAARVGRSINACQKKLYKLLGRTGHLQGWTTINALIEEHGHGQETYIKAARELGIKPKLHKTAKGRLWRLFTDEQVDRILEHLERPTPFLTQGGMPAHRWARGFDCCLYCGTDGTEYQQRHGGNGLCVSCHQRWRRGTIVVASLPPFRALRKRWSLRYDCCTACGTTSRQHTGKGLCDACKRRVKQRKLEPLLAFFRLVALDSDLEAPILDPMDTTFT
jgi:hypothetical protein